ncbi:MAG: FkbM family methyltransferase [Rickettsiaceae bacterium]
MLALEPGTNFFLRLYNNKYSKFIACPKTPFNGARDIYFSQRHEDYILANVFSNLDKGFYVDVGAHDPDQLSVTKYFYQRGWRGINFEPLVKYHERLKQKRPEDKNINKAVSNKKEILSLYVPMKRDTLSSFDKNIISKIFSNNIEEYKVETVTLTEVFQELKIKEIDFLKVDVEGAEDKVIAGLDFNQFRPKIIVLEFLSLVDKNGEKKFGPIMKENGYILGTSDTLNHYYYRQESPELGMKLNRIGKCAALDLVNMN